MNGITPAIGNPRSICIRSTGHSARDVSRSTFMKRGAMPAGITIIPLGTITLPTRRIRGLTCPLNPHTAHDTRSPDNLVSHFALLMDIRIATEGRR